MDLRKIVDVLREDDLTALYMPKTADSPAELVNVVMEIEGFDEPLVLQIMRTNADGKNFPGLMMLQFFAGLPVKALLSQQDDVVEALTFINMLVPLMGFNYNGEENIIFFRHVALIPEEGEGANQVLQQTVWLAFFVLEKWGNELAGVATGDIDLESLLNGPTDFDA